ncbi:class I SAM-dependent methyltransferase [Anaerosolibacter sp.]|uniref:class I SAM-dependent methyltransferase n=1 Tax=Anaerosolibacter sp. TaxID=1872527 RepID=UPI0039F077A5
MDNSSNIRIFSTWSKIYDIFFGSKFINKQRKIAIELLAVKPGDKVLLIGIGTGEDLRFLPERVKVVGVDITEKMLLIAKQKAEILGMKDYEILNMDGQNLKMEDNTFDAVILNMILAVIPDGNQCLQEAHRVLKPSGRIVVFDKFLQENKGENIFRILLNKITERLGTDINRRFSDIMGDVELEVIEDRKSIFGGMYRIILLGKRLASGSIGCVEKWRENKHKSIKVHKN